jgi:hypothetical protein
MNLLILEQRAEEYKKSLQPKFPELTIHATSKEEEVGDFIEKMDILLGIRISDGLIKKGLKTEMDPGPDDGSRLSHQSAFPQEGCYHDLLSRYSWPTDVGDGLPPHARLEPQFPQVVRNQDKNAWERWEAKLLWKKKVGILGIGVIGEEIARKCKAFGMEVIGIDIVHAHTGAPDDDELRARLYDVGGDASLAAHDESLIVPYDSFYLFWLEFTKSSYFAQ